jgi:glycosyltransferase involved in cell wall biosynthesis
VKRVLMVSNCYPPMASPGALRSAKFAKYLPEFGWEPVVLSPRGGWSSAMGMAEVDGVRVVRTAHLGAVEAVAAGAVKSQSGGAKAKVVRALRTFVYPDRVGPWYPFALAAGVRLMRAERFDALYSTAPSLVNHAAAMHLSRMFGVPWVADFRDLWTLAPFYTATGTRARLDRRLEGRIMRHADAVATVSNQCAEAFRGEYPDAADKVHVIRNGYDPDDLPPAAPPPPGPFVLTYAGMFYAGRRDPSGLFAALAALRAEGALPPEGFRMDIIGDPDPVVLRMVDEAGVGDLVRHTGRLSYAETLARLSASSALCVITFTDDGAQGEMTTKLFEYIGVGRPILALAIPGSELGEVVSSGGLGGVFGHGDVAGIAAWLRGRMRPDAGVAPLPPPEVLYPFTRRAGAQELARQLDAAAAARSS